MNKLWPEAGAGFCGDGLWGMFTSADQKKNSFIHSRQAVMQHKKTKQEYLPEMSGMLGFSESVDFTEGDAMKYNKKMRHMKHCWGTCRAKRMYMWVCLTWSSSKTLNGHHAAVGSLGQRGRAHFAGGSRLSGLHHRWLWEGGIQGTDWQWEALTWTLGKSCVLHGDLNTWKRQIWSEWWGWGCGSKRGRCRARCLEVRYINKPAGYTATLKPLRHETYLPWTFNIWLLTGIQRYEQTFGPTVVTLQQYLLQLYIFFSSKSCPDFRQRRKEKQVTLIEQPHQSSNKRSIATSLPI